MSTHATYSDCQATTGEWDYICEKRIDAPTYRNAPWGVRIQKIGFKVELNASGGIGGDEKIISEQRLPPQR